MSLLFDIHYCVVNLNRCFENGALHISNTWCTASAFCNQTVWISIDYSASRLAAAFFTNWSDARIPRSSVRFASRPACSPPALLDKRVKCVAACSHRRWMSCLEWRASVHRSSSPSKQHHTLLFYLSNLLLSALFLRFFVSFYWFVTSTQFKAVPSQ